MITEKDVKHIAELARIRLSEKEVEKFQQELGKILAFVEKLNEVPTSQVEPLTGGILRQAQDRLSVTRSDEEPSGEHERLRSEEIREDLVRKAPEQEAGFMKVKAVFERE